MSSIGSASVRWSTYLQPQLNTTQAIILKHSEILIERFRLCIAETLSPTAGAIPQSQALC